MTVQLLMLLMGLACTAAAVYATASVRHIVEQKRAERVLAAELAADADFRERLSRYADEVYQYGHPRAATVGELWRYVRGRAAAVRPHGVLVVEALSQPALGDRYRYLRKLVTQALETMLDVPVDELELKSTYVAREELATV